MSYEREGQEETRHAIPTASCLHLPDMAEVWVFLEHVVVFFFFLTFVLFSLRVERLRFQFRFPRSWCVALMSTDFGLLILSYQ
jgi:hypothetical protein